MLVVSPYLLLFAVRGQGDADHGRRRPARRLRRGAHLHGLGERHRGAYLLSRQLWEEPDAGLHLRALYSDPASDPVSRRDADVMIEEQPARARAAIDGSAAAPGDRSAVASMLSTFAKPEIEREFAQQAYTAALASLEPPRQGRAHPALPRRLRRAPPDEGGALSGSAPRHPDDAAPLGARLDTGGGLGVFMGCGEHAA